MPHSGFEKHDHDSCVANALGAAEERCAESKLQLTPVRRRVLEILLSRHQAMGAYDILGQLAQEGLGSQPPVVYRALDFLVSNGFVHKVEKLNAFMACAQPGTRHSPVIMICRTCGAAAEAPVTPQSDLSRAADEAGFQIERTVIEAEGLCPACQKKEAQS